MSLMGATLRRLQMVVPEAIESTEYTTIREFEKLTNSKLETLTAFFADNAELHIKYLQNKRRNKILKNLHRLKSVEVRLRAGESPKVACRKEGMSQATYYKYRREYARFCNAA